MFILTISFSVSDGSWIIAPSGEHKDHMTEEISSKDVLEDGEVRSHVLIQPWYLTVILNEYDPVDSQNLRGRANSGKPF